MSTTAWAATSLSIACATRPPRRAKMAKMAIAAGFLGALVLTTPFAAPAADFPQPLPVEPIPRVLSLPSAYPDTWAFINTVYGVELIDTAAKAPDHVRGQLGASPFPSLMAARTRPEVYLAETFYSRGTHGVRTDVVTIYDTR